MSKTINILETIMFILLIVVGFITGFLFTQIFGTDDIFNNNYKTDFETERDIVSNCKGYNLKNSCECLNENIKEIFYYNKTDESINLTLDDLKKRGGDCRDWSMLYSRLGGKLGFYNNTIKFKLKVNETNKKRIISNHQIAIISNKNGYCVLDQENLNYYLFRE